MQLWYSRCISCNKMWVLCCQLSPMPVLYSFSLLKYSVLILEIFHLALLRSSFAIFYVLGWMSKSLYKKQAPFRGWAKHKPGYILASSYLVACYKGSLAPTWISDPVRLFAGLALDGFTLSPYVGLLHHLSPLPFGSSFCCAPLGRLTGCYPGICPINGFLTLVRPSILLRDL